MSRSWEPRDGDGMRRSAWLGLLAAVVFIPAAAGAAGDVDTSFGSNGLAIVDVRPGYTDQVRDIVVQPDGKVLLAGESAEPGNPINSEPALVRLNADGTPDAGFGTAGVVVGDFGAAIDDTAYAVALQKDGKILLGGLRGRPDVDGAIARYLPNGTLDASFGTGGIVTTPGSCGSVMDLVVQPNGRIVAALLCAGVGIARYLPDGSPDAGFGTGGVTEVPLPSVGANKVTTVLLRGDGRIVVAGSGWTPVTDGDDLFAVQLLAGGAPDPGFGNSGLAFLYHSGGELANSAALQPDGKVVVSGGGVLGRVTTAGQPDVSFGTGGIVPILTSTFQGAGVVIAQPDGKLLLVGPAAVSPPEPTTALVRLLADGSLDPSFGTGGMSVAKASRWGETILVAWVAAARGPNDKLDHRWHGRRRLRLVRRDPLGNGLRAPAGPPRARVLAVAALTPARTRADGCGSRRTSHRLHTRGVENRRAPGTAVRVSRARRRGVRRRRRRARLGRPGQAVRGRRNGLCCRVQRLRGRGRRALGALAGPARRRVPPARPQPGAARRSWRRRRARATTRRP